MAQHDQLHRYLFEHAVRGELVTVSETRNRFWKTTTTRYR